MSEAKNILPLVKMMQGDQIGTGITLSSGKDARLRLRREHDLSGFETYIIENLAKRESLRVPRFIFEFFKAAVDRAVAKLDGSEFNEITVEFKGRVKYRIEAPKSVGPRIIAEDGKEGCAGCLHVNANTLKLLQRLLHDDRLPHGSDVLKRILAYHKLFKFTFSEGSESLNSGLSLRTDVLSQVEDYVPPIGKRSSRGQLTPVLKDSETQRDQGNISLKEQLKLKEVDQIQAKVFKSRLAERDGARAWKVDYQALFSDAGPRAVDRQPKVNSGEESKKDGSRRHAWLIPLLSSEFKLQRSASWRCELSSDEMRLMRESFLEARDSEYYLGFDIVDAIYRVQSGKLKTFRFPLYYMPIDIQESGRVIILSPKEHGRFYLNHLALATLVESFSKDSNVEGAVEEFFATLLAQKIEVSGGLSRIYLSRTMPCSEEIFDRTRDVLLGSPGENGKGGILGSLEMLGAECDTEAVYLYKASRETAPLQRALELDLEVMQDVAERATERFSKTIPGRFLSSSSGARSKRPFCRTPYMPSFLPPSTRRLIDKLNNHDIVLLEGPPGTGKTHTIMNLLIHAICSGQRILIVSDQEAAIHALTEKVEGYLVAGQGGERSDDLRLWRQAVKVMDRLQGGYKDLSEFCRTLDECLNVSSTQDFYKDLAEQKLPLDAIAAIDQQIDKHKEAIARILDARMGSKSDVRKRVGSKRGHATTASDISAFIAFLKFMGSGEALSKAQEKHTATARKVVRQFILHREYLNSYGDSGLYSWFDLPAAVVPDHFQKLSGATQLIEKLIKMRPHSVEALRQVLAGEKSGRIPKHFMDLWMKIFPPGEGGVKSAFRVLQSLIHHPARKHLKMLLTILRSQKSLFEIQHKLEPGVWRQLKQIHDALTPGFKGPLPLSLEVCRFTTSPSFVFGQSVNRLPAVQESLEALEKLESQRGELVRRLFVARLAKIQTFAHTSVDGGSNRITQISSMLQGLKTQDHLESGIGVWRELQERLLETFPIWLCRKQAVSFLFPCKEKLFDLVIVDEATQCRVDDALPLMFRARKVMVVGDDKQTVLAKNSVIDDYLFKEFNLDEHLRGTQARGIKGGGSHIFGLIKGIKEGGVMLDEHYRCPPAIIEYSNRYVYNSELKVMQWTRKDQSASVAVDWSERDKPESQRPENGAFKGIEIDMIDRFLEYVASSIKKIERETGKPVSMEHDVALCYFLLKNEPYVKAKKSEFLARLGRGNDVLDGAGAALQGKERPYIFYLWDISRSNMMAFRQGDDPDKRKGELNVLMSRPKRRAYHYLHKNFDKLEHERASITDYLWKAFQEQSQGEQKVEYTERKIRPSSSFIPWRRSSGALMEAMLQHMQVSGANLPLDRLERQTGVVVGDPRFKVDVVLSHGDKSVGIVDLCGFEWHEDCAEDVVDYYFQLKRAEPKVSPVFLFMHELADSRSRAFQRLLMRFEGQ